MSDDAITADAAILEAMPVRYHLPIGGNYPVFDLPMDDWKPCAPITCPPLEEHTIDVIALRERGVLPLCTCHPKPE